MHIFTPQREIMWVHPDLVESKQWTTVTNRKSKSKAKASPCNIVCVSSQEAETDVPSRTNSEEEINFLAVELNASLVAPGQSYLKKYNEMVTNLPKITPEPTKQSTKQPVEKQKEIRYAKAFPKDK